VIAVDTNLLVHAHRRDSQFHGSARDCLAELSERAPSWSIPWPCLHEFLAIVTHPRVYRPASTLEQGMKQVDAWLESPGLQLLAETEGYWEVFHQAATAARTVGPAVHDVRIAALCLANGVSELWRADRDFGRFPALKVRNPLVQT